MQLTGIDLFFWLTGFVGGVLLLAVLWGRRRARTFPFFTALTAIAVLRTIVLYLVRSYGSKHDYLVAYLVLGTLDLALQLCVIYELATHVFRPVGRWAPDTRSSFIVMSCGSAAVAALVTCLAAPAAPSWMRALLTRGNLFSSLLNVELFVGMTVLSSTVRLPWKTHVARIAQGLGVYSLVGILTSAGQSLFGTDHASRVAVILSQARIFSYLLCLGYWVIMLWREAPAPRPLPDEIRQQLFGLQRRVEFDLQRLRSWKRL